MSDVSHTLIYCAVSQQCIVYIYTSPMMTDFVQRKEVMVYTEWKVHSSVVATVTSKCSDQTWPGYWTK